MTMTAEAHATDDRPYSPGLEGILAGETSLAPSMARTAA